jgi:hypothetical protein
VSVQFNENILAIWYMPLTDHSDFLAALSRDLSVRGGLIYLNRFRYYESGDPWDPRDRKNWYELRTTDPVETTIRKLRKVHRIAAENRGMMSDASKDRLFELIRGDMSVDRFMRKFAQQPFVHTRKMAPGDMQEYERRCQAARELYDARNG